MATNSEKQAASGGVGVAGLLGVAFVVLKLTHHIDWEWKWVLAPFWVPVALWLAVMLVILSVVAIGTWVSSR